MSKKSIIIIGLAICSIFVGSIVGVNQKLAKKSYTINRNLPGSSLRRLVYSSSVHVFCPLMGEKSEEKFSGLVAVMLPAYTYQKQELRENSNLVELVQKENQRANQTSTESGNTQRVCETYNEIELASENEKNKSTEQLIMQTAGQPETLQEDHTNEANTSDDNSTTETKTDVETTEEPMEEPTEEASNLSEESQAAEMKEVMAAAKLYDFDYLLQHYYIVDSSTTVDSSLLNAKRLLKEDMSILPRQGGNEGSADFQPQILIYHTHSQEGFSDSVMEEGANAKYAYEAATEETSVMKVGDVLTDLLTNQYGYSVLHHKGRYDVGDRNHAYSNEAPELEKILKQYPSIQVVIDLHRDKADTRLVTDINGEKTAKIMFFNGLSRTASQGAITYLPNKYLKQNLAFSFQMQLTAETYYPDFSRKIYLKGYRYNMNYCPKSLLIEVGAQNNTLQEAENAMVPLAEILSKVLSSSN